MNMLTTLSGDGLTYWKQSTVDLNSVKYIVCQLYTNKKNIDFSVAQTWIQIPRLNPSSPFTECGTIGKSLNLFEAQHFYL